MTVTQLESSAGRWLWFAGHAAILASCVFNFALTPYFECQLDGNCVDDVAKSWWSGVYARSLSVSCFVSFAVSWTRYRGTMAAYDRWMELHEAYAATSAAERRSRGLVNRIVVSLCVAVIVPVAAFRLYQMYCRKTGALSYFVIMYAHNLIMCLFETRFVLFSYVLYTKFVKVNRDMELLNIRLQMSTADRRSARQPQWSRLADAVEQLKIRHRLIREAVDDLNHAFAVPLVMSLCNLCVMATFDVYYQVMNVFVQHTSNRSVVYVYLWITQYMFRFFVIVSTAHAMMKQALKSKEVVTNASNHCLDDDTKEELEIFSNQISSTEMEFTICGLFTLKTNLFSSAIGAGITYLVILVQMKASTDNIY